MIELKQDLYISAGTRRECYRHPGDPGRCIKVLKEGREDDMQSKREQIYFAKCIRRGVPFDGMARFHGTVETNLGEGNVFDLIRDHDGEISRPVKHFLLSGRPLGSFEELLADLQDHLLRQRIVVSDLNGGNLLVQRQADGSEKLILIDGIGNSDFIKVCDYFRFFQAMKVKRKWKSLMRRLRKLEVRYLAGAEREGRREPERSGRPLELIVDGDRLTGS